MVEAGAHDPRVALIGEGFRLIEQFLALGRVQPGLEVRFGIEAQDGQPIVLNTGDRRLAPIALKARRLRLRFGDAPPPFEIGAFLPWLDPCREIGFRFSRLESRV